MKRLFLYLLALPLFCTGLCFGENYRYSTVAGRMGGRGSSDGQGLTARFSEPYGVAVDAVGNVYVADSNIHTIRKISPLGKVTTLAGLAGNIGSADGKGSEARFNYPRGLAVDNAGNLYVVDAGNFTVRKVSPSGEVTTIAGLAETYGSDDGTGANARFCGAEGIALDNDGNIYVADTGNRTVRKITTGGVVSTFAGLAGAAGSADGTGSAARFFAPTSVAVDSDGNVYVTDRDYHTIRKITPSRVVSTYAGQAESSGSSDGPAADARFYIPRGVTVNAAGTVYVTDSSGRIRAISKERVVSTLAGYGDEYGFIDGLGSSARFRGVELIAVDPNGMLYIADAGNYCIRKVTAAGVVSTFAGSNVSAGTADGAGLDARFYSPHSLARDKQGNLYVSDNANSSIRKITPAGVVSTLAGDSGNSGFSDGLGAAATFRYPEGLALDSHGNLFVADAGNHTIRKVTPEGLVSTFAGLAQTPGWDNGQGAAARFNWPRGLVIDSTDNVYIADYNNRIIRKITPQGLVSTFAGTLGDSGTNDGTGSNARFNGPGALALDAQNNIFVADVNNDSIRKITPEAVVSTYAYSYGLLKGIDGGGYVDRFRGPSGLAVDKQGNVYVTAATESTISKITPDGAVYRIGKGYGAIDGLGTLARFYHPQGLAVDSSSVLYIADSFNQTIRKGVPLNGADFNQDGSEDILWSQTSSGERGLWLLNEGSYTGAAAMLPTIPASWKTVGFGDFNNDGSTDLLWQNTDTGDVYVWYMDGSAYSGLGDFITRLPLSWTVAGAGDFNNDGSPDIVWQNLSTGDRYIWYMNGATYTGEYSFLGNVPANWLIVACGDMDRDSQPDLIWRNTGTGEVGEWLMDGAGVKSTLTFGSIPLNWSLRQLLDINSDGSTDILWSNLQNGELGAWLMDGPNYTGSARMLPSTSSPWMPGACPANGTP